MSFPATHCPTFLASVIRYYEHQWFVYTTGNAPECSVILATHDGGAVRVRVPVAEVVYITSGFLE